MNFTYSVIILANHSTGSHEINISRFEDVSLSIQDHEFYDRAEPIVGVSYENSPIV